MKSTQKNKILKDLAQLLKENKSKIIDANKEDISNCKNISKSLLDRLTINEEKIKSMIQSIKTVIALRDPEEKVLYEYIHENKMVVKNKTIAFGNILIIYESRPDVTIEASILAFKAGNNVLLKGGSEAMKSNKILVNLWHKALKQNGFKTNIVTYLDLDRKKTQELIKNNTKNLDLIIPRGGEGLIKFVKENAQVPIIISGRGNNFSLVDKKSDFNKAIEIILNGKSRVSVCNALDKVLLHKDLPNIEDKVKKLVDKLIDSGIEVFGNKTIYKLDSRIHLEDGNEILKQEFLDKKIYLKITDTLTEAITIINKYSGGHSATIISSDIERANKFQKEVDCAAVYHNVSTRFTDGGQWGFGAEIAISTQKLHFRGPIGLNQLVTNKWYISGNGQIRK